ncbi:hypothetical protein ZEAMMB73_Zm00001d049515 [Zea mays]|uniref:Uncharacterized protein n=1 Tax=Zea mays TaxID=4577 RepID=A0A1D6PVT9_MAIZE|nr:hypothetical protein ZEAMMB73_Zm00001d049515 [Zea mays]
MDVEGKGQEVFVELLLMFCLSSF